MAKKRYKKRSDRNVGISLLNGEGDSSNDTKNQIDLSIGSPEYEEYKEKHKSKPDDEFHTNLEVQNQSLRHVQLRKDEISEAFGKTGRHKYRVYMSKHVQIRQATKVIEAGLGRDISKKDFEDELHNDGITAKDFMHESATDYKKEFKRVVEEPTVDTNHDGKIDDDDLVPMTKAQRRLARYM